MYIPTQEVRYSKVARITLFLCVMAPSAIVAWLGGIHGILDCAIAFLWPPALPLIYFGLQPILALCVSALLQGGIFFCAVKSRRLTARGKATLAITWGMLFAYILRLALAYEAWQSVVPHTAR